MFVLKSAPFFESVAVVSMFVVVLTEEVLFLQAASNNTRAGRDRYRIMAWIGAKRVPTGNRRPMILRSLFWKHIRLSMNANSSFLAKRLHIYLLLAVVATTLVQWFLVNSLLILLLVGC